MLICYLQVDLHAVLLLQDFLNMWWRGKWGVLPHSYNAQKGIIHVSMTCPRIV